MDQSLTLGHVNKQRLKTALARGVSDSSSSSSAYFCQYFACMFGQDDAGCEKYPSLRLPIGSWIAKAVLRPGPAPTCLSILTEYLHWCILSWKDMVQEPDWQDNADCCFWCPSAVSCLVVIRMKYVISGGTRLALTVDENACDEGTVSVILYKGNGFITIDRSSEWLPSRLSNLSDY